MPATSREMRTLPSRMMKSLSPGSPYWKIRVPSACDSSVVTCAMSVEAPRASARRRTRRLRELILALRSSGWRSVIHAEPLERASVAGVRGEPALGLERGHAAGAGGGDGLAVDEVLDVAGGEDARRRWSASCPGLVRM